MKKTEFQKAILRLAKAMEQGCKKSRKANGEFVRVAETGAIYACAIGAAYINGFSKSFAERGYNQDRMCDRHPILLETGQQPFSAYLQSTIISLNDNYRWSRERIIRWLRKLAEQPEKPDVWSPIVT